MPLLLAARVPVRFTTALLLVAGFTGMTAVLLWPLPLHLASRVANDPVDPLLNAWLLWHGAHAAPWSPAWWNPPAFAPMTGALALSEHLLGFLWAAAPALWLGAEPVAVVNTLLLLSAPLSGVAMTLLVRHLTGRLDAAIVAGALFAFTPYRLAHLAHVQTVFVCWAPLALWALHRYVETPRWRWAVASAVAWLLLATTSGYHLVFFSLVLAGWAVWFLRPWAGGRWLPLLCAWSVALALAAAPLLGYREVQEQQGLERGKEEMEQFSVQLDDFGRAPALSAMWGGRDAHGRSEETAVFPGLALPLAVALWFVVPTRRRGTASSATGQTAATPRGRPRRGWRRIVVAVCALAGLLSLVALVLPLHLRLAGHMVTLTSPAKSGGIAAAAALVLLLTSAPVERAWRRRSLAGFYLLAAGATALLAMGPTVRVDAATLWVYAPYDWLTVLPGVAAARVPARFWLWTVCLLSVAAGLALARLPRRRPVTALAAALIALAVGDGWPRTMPLAQLPAPPVSAIRGVTGPAAVVELPIGDPTRDVAAMYRGIAHRLPVINGYSGHVPTHYRLLLVAAGERDASIFEAMRRSRPLLVRVDRTAPDAQGLDDWVRRAGGRLDVDRGTVAIYSLPPAPPVSTAGTQPLRPAAVHDLVTGADVMAPLVDADERSRWHTPGPQQAGAGLIVTLDAAPVAGLTLAIGPYLVEYPRRLAIDVEVTADAATAAVAAGTSGWRTVWEGPTAGLAIDGALTSPLDPAIVLRWPPVTTGRLRLRALDSHDTDPWSVARLEVLRALVVPPDDAPSALDRR